MVANRLRARVVISHALLETFASHRNSPSDELSARLTNEFIESSNWDFAVIPHENLCVSAAVKE